MKIALISESPTVATGFGTVAQHLVRLLDTLGQEVVVFGVCADGQPFDLTQLPCRIAPMPRDQRVAIERLGSFLAAEQPDILFVHYDLAAACRFIERARAEGWSGPVIAHFVMDGLPFKRAELETLRTIDVGMTPTHTAMRYCLDVGLERIIAAPHPADAFTFRPLPDREKLRQAAGLAGRFVVGVFGRNVERKQHPRVLLALRSLVQQDSGNDVLVYMHCQPKNEAVWLNGWDLEEIADQLEIADRVLFPPPHFEQLRGVPYQASNAEALAMSASPATPAIPAHYSYVERLNLCDIIVNVASCGAFELSTLEAQLCGVPVAVTNDNGAMAEVAGAGAILLEPVDIAIHASGAYQCFVGPQTIADAIMRVKSDAALRASLLTRGAANAARYTSEPLRAALQSAIRIVTAADR